MQGDGVPPGGWEPSLENSPFPQRVLGSRHHQLPPSHTRLSAPTGKVPGTQCHGCCGSTGGIFPTTVPGRVEKPALVLVKPHLKCLQRLLHPRGSDQAPPLAPLPPSAMAGGVQSLPLVMRSPKSEAHTLGTTFPCFKSLGSPSRMPAAVGVVPFISETLISEAGTAAGSGAWLLPTDTGNPPLGPKTGVMPSMTSASSPGRAACFP